jgi:hypothetical protein
MDQYKTIKGSFGGLTPKKELLDPKAFYNIDWGKVQRAEDLALIMAAIGFNFVGNHPRIHIVERFLDTNNPMYYKDEIIEETKDDEGGL